MLISAAVQIRASSSHLNNSKLKEWDAGKVCGIWMMERWVVLAKTEPPLVSGGEGESQRRKTTQAKGAGRCREG